VGLIQVLNFKKHQNPHHTEKKSELPAPVNPLLSNGENPADSLIPDSRIYSPSSPTTRKTKTRKTPLPQNFNISERVRKWAAEKGHTRLEDRLEHFVSYAKRSGKTYADWDEALMTAIRENWANLPADKPVVADIPDPYELTVREHLRARAAGGKVQ